MLDRSVSRWDDRYTIDRDVEFIRLDLIANGDAGLLETLKGSLREDERHGWCGILYMDERVAVVQWYDQFILTLSDEVRSTALSLQDSSPAAAEVGAGEV